MATQMGMIVPQGATKPISRAQIAWVNCPVVRGGVGGHDSRPSTTSGLCSQLRFGLRPELLQVLTLGLSALTLRIEAQAHP
jgi:hypothetical protein